MSAIAATIVEELRDLTGAGSLDCEAALVETNGDMEAAIDWLRQKGLSQAAKKAGRTSFQGLVGVAVAQNGREAAIVEINCDSDFVTRNGAFQEIVVNVAKVVLTNGTADAIRDARYPGSDKSVTETIEDAVGGVGENISFRRSAKLTVEHGAVATYVHNSFGDGLGKLAVLVAIRTAGNEHAANAFGRQIAMHIAVTNPLALTEDQIDPAAVEREKETFSDQARQSGKSEAIIEKMVEGRLRRFYEECVLLKQPFVLNPDITVEKALKDAEKEIGAPAKISAYLRFALGEGIEREETDFAAEVVAVSTQKRVADEIKIELKEKWSSSPAISLCTKIVDFIAGSLSGQSQPLTLKTIMRVVDKDEVDEDLFVALGILAGTRINALVARAVLIDENDQEYDIELDELSKARRSGDLKHPETGQSVPGYEDKVFPYFVPTSRFGFAK